MKSIVILALLLLSPTTARAAELRGHSNIERIEEYIGRKSSQLPDARLENDVSLAHDMTFEEYVVGDQRVLILSKGRGPASEVVDAIARPKIEHGQSLFPPSHCTSGRGARYNVFAIASHSDGKANHRALAAWQINTKTRRFETTSPRFVRCTDGGERARDQRR